MLMKLSMWASGVVNKLNGSVAFNTPNGLVWRTNVIPTNPNTPAQQAVRSAFAALSSSWKSRTPSERSAWNNAVADFKRTNVFGDIKTPSGFNLYGKLNNQLRAIGVAPLTVPPLPTTVFAFTSLSVVADTTLGTMNISFTGVIPVGSSVIVSATPGVSPGKNFVKSEFRQIKVLTSADLSPEDVAAEYIAKFGALPTVGKKVFIGFKVVVDTTGQAGTVLQASDIAV